MNKIPLEGYMFSFVAFMCMLSITPLNSNDDFYTGTICEYDFVRYDGYGLITIGYEVYTNEYRDYREGDESRYGEVKSVWYSDDVDIVRAIIKIKE